MALSGYDQPIGSAAKDDEPGAERHELEEQMRAAIAAENEATKAAAVAIEQRTQAQKRLLRAKTEQAKSAVEMSLVMSDAELKEATRIAADKLRSATGVLAVAGSEGRWPGWLEKALTEAREQAGPGETPAAVLVRSVSATGRHDDGVALIIDMSGRLPKPTSGLSADDHARRVRARQGI